MTTEPSNHQEKEPLEENDFLWEQLRDLPYFRALLRAVEARSYQQFEFPAPLLDMGCGDGHFAAAAFKRPIDVGIDPWYGPLRQAARRGSYRMVVYGFGNWLPFPDGYFGGCISNSVLEHIPDVDAVLKEIARVLKPGGLFIFCVPNHQFLGNLSVSSFLDRIRLRFLGDAYRRFFNWISRHHHCDAPEVWQNRLSKAGFQVERWWHYFSPEAFHVLEWGHYLGLPALASHFLLGRWILSPTKWNLAITRAIVQRFYDELPEQPQGSYTFYVTRRNTV
ncbi:MAG: class I SAM-dependent methyltransferase [Anaerolineae bacterium]|nr:class I SAM-dependent methyltransferase [Anaerolineae bacterium]